MTNIFVFWRPSADPPAPWTRLTRQGRYIRFTDILLAHLGQVGAASHYHANSLSSWWCGTCNNAANSISNDESSTMLPHEHGWPSLSISAVDNNPAWYGLDIIYMDLTVWESYERRFPDGAIVMSSQVLSDPGFMERFTAADGRYIVNTTPGSTGGVTENKQHYCQGTTANSGTSGTYGYLWQYVATLLRPASHPHNFAAWSDGRTNEPRNLTTRLYEILAQTIMAKTGTVVFCDGTPGANWEVQSGWANANLKSGDSNPTLSGADSHDQSISGNTGGTNLSNGAASQYGTGPACPNKDHIHPFSGTLAAENHIPLSSLLVPYKLKFDLYHGTAQRAARIIGPLY